MPPTRPNRYSGPTGKAYTGQASVKQSYYQQLQTGDMVTVYYLPGLPRWSGLEAAQSATSRAPFLITALLTLIGWIGALGIVTYGLLPGLALGLDSSS